VSTNVLLCTHAVDVVAAVVRSERRRRIGAVATGEYLVAALRQRTVVIQHARATCQQYAGHYIHFIVPCQNTEPCCIENHGAICGNAFMLYMYIFNATNLSRVARLRCMYIVINRGNPSVFSNNSKQFGPLLIITI